MKLSDKNSLISSVGTNRNTIERLSIEDQNPFKNLRSDRKSNKTFTSSFHWGKIKK